MEVKIDDDYAAASFRVARLLYEQISAKPEAVICLASGETPLLAYNLLTALLINTPVACRQFTLIGLDEWVGVPPENTGSCSHFLHTHVIEPLQLPAARVKLFDAMAPDPEEECRAMDAFIKMKGGIDLMVVGIGMNGHIGFNEPGAATDWYSHVTDLDETTQRVGQKYFSTPESLPRGITLGLAHLMEAGKVVLVASGARKAPIVKAALEGELTKRVPATIMRRHPNGLVVIDREAAALLNRPDGIAG